MARQTNLVIHALEIAPDSLESGESNGESFFTFGG